jgi:hypothetical protein
MFSPRPRSTDHGKLCERIENSFAGISEMSGVFERVHQ